MLQNFHLYYVIMSGCESVILHMFKAVNLQNFDLKVTANLFVEIISVQNTLWQPNSGIHLVFKFRKNEMMCGMCIHFISTK